MTILLLTVLAGTCGTRALAQEWSRFRGPNGSGLGLAINLPARWAEADYRWKATLPGAGHSSPVLWGGSVFVTGADRPAGKFVVAALDTTDGRLRWQRDFPVAHYTLHRNNSLATATPAVDERHLFVPRVEGRDLVLTALNRTNGAPAWEFNAGGLVTEHGLGHSPIVHDGRVILAHDHDEKGRIVALDTVTGRLLWETPRRPGRADYSVPAISEAEGRDAWLIFNSQEDGICAVQPADGRVVWRSPTVLTMRSVSSPVTAAGLLFSSCGSGGGGNYVVALRPPTVPAGVPTIAYQVRKSAPYVPTPLALGELLFLWSDGGIVTCLRAASGEQLWQERVGGNYFSSPICADGKLINLSTTGEVVVLAAGAKYELHGRNPLGEGGHATPAVAHGCLFVRTLGQLLCVGPTQ